MNKDNPRTRMSWKRTGILDRSVIPDAMGKSLGRKRSNELLEGIQ
jgi:hypothetical protein